MIIFNQIEYRYPTSDIFQDKDNKIWMLMKISINFKCSVEVVKCYNHPD